MPITSASQQGSSAFNTSKSNMLVKYMEVIDTWTLRLLTLCLQLASRSYFLEDLSNHFAPLWPCLQRHPSVRMVTLNVWLSLTCSATYSYQETLLLYTRGAGHRGCPRLRYWFSQTDGEPLPRPWLMEDARIWWSTQPVLLGQVFVLPTVTMDQCYHDSMSCPHRRWESETGRLVLTGEITISKPINIFNHQFKGRKTREWADFFFSALKVLELIIMRRKHCHPIYLYRFP